MTDKADRNTLHAAGLGRLHTGNGVLHHDALRRRHAQLPRCHLEHLWVGLAALRIFRRRNGVEELGAVRDFQDQFDIGLRGAGADGLLEAGRVQSLQQGADAGQQVYPLAGGSAVQFFLVEALLVYLRRAQAVAEQVLEDLRVAKTESGGEVGPRERTAQLLAQRSPGPEVHLRRIDQGPIDVPDNGTIVRGHDCPSVGGDPSGSRNPLQRSPCVGIRVAAVLYGVRAWRKICPRPSGTCTRPSAAGGSWNR